MERIENTTFSGGDYPPYASTMFHSCTFENFPADFTGFSNCLFSKCKFDVFCLNLYDSILFQCEISTSKLYLQSTSITYSEISNIDVRFCAELSTLNTNNYYNCFPKAGRITKCVITGHCFDPRSNDFSNLTTGHDNKLDGFAFSLGFPISQICPSEGPFIAYKRLQGPYIAKLLIPSHAQRVGSLDRKYRASEAEVLSITNFITGEECAQGVSTYDKDFIYEVGKIVRPATPFDPNPANLCTNGIHFFMAKDEAIDYIDTVPHRTYP